jgi:hypothetical protein
MNAKTKKIIIISIALLLAAPVVYADIVFCGGKTENACTFQDLFKLVYIVVNFLISGAGLAALLYVVIGGLQMLLSAGNPTKIQEAKSTIKNAILGLILVMLAYLIVGYFAGLILPNSADPINALRDFLK